MIVSLYGLPYHPPRKSAYRLLQLWGFNSWREVPLSGLTVKFVDGSTVDLVPREEEFYSVVFGLWLHRVCEVEIHTWQEINAHMKTEVLHFYGTKEPHEEESFLWHFSHGKEIFLVSS